MGFGKVTQTRASPADEAHVPRANRIPVPALLTTNAGTGISKGVLAPGAATIDHLEERRTTIAPRY